ncbi:MAG: DoxX family protein [Methylobacter sp.]|uniref:DoxX family protein n=1 Tax=Candidatus Methylobacter titanis TaxID=3053457 RepID=A0AA43Q6C1_9GAMM|nr:DoxX family protein [Candidatus Methylobacter titanis]MDI1294167.1 DoxX family protein [Candidatus Methylobacter titanis]
MNDHSLSDADCVISSTTGCVCAIPGELSRWFDSRAQGLAPLFLRLLLAYEFGEAGLEKLNGDNWFADRVFPFPINLLSAELNWTLATGLEIIAPTALILGLATRFFSLALMLLTVVAIAAVHWPVEWHSVAELWKGYAISDQGYGNYKLPLMYLLMLASLVFSGSGRLGVDAWLTSQRQSVHR